MSTVLRNRSAWLLVFAVVSSSLSTLAVSADATVTGVIRGTLFDAKGEPLKGYRLKVTDAMDTIYESSATGPDGTYSVNGLPPGTYTSDQFKVIDPEGNIVPLRLPPVTVEAGSTVTQRLALLTPTGRSKAPRTAYVVGWSTMATALAIAIAAAQDDDDEGTPTMTPGGP